MAAGIYNFAIEQGATLNKVITWKDGDNAAINLTGYTAVAQFRPTISASPVLTLSSVTGGITLGGRLERLPLARLRPPRPHSPQATAFGSSN
jgi:hypothetical protein